MKAYTDIEQSKKLAEILQIETSDSHYVRKICDHAGNPVDGKWSKPNFGNPNSVEANYFVQNFESYEVIPCWSLNALIYALPTLDEEYEPLIFRLGNRFTCSYEGMEESKGIFTAGEILVDVIFEMIVKLYDQGYKYKK